SVLGLHAAVLGPPGVEAGGTEAVLATQFRHRHAGLGLLDESDDLLGCEATLAHVRPLGLTDFTASRGTAQRGQVIPSNWRDVVDFALSKPKVARSLRDSSWVLGALVGFLSWGLGALGAALAGLGVWTAIQILAVVVESIVVRDS